MDDIVKSNFKERYSVIEKNIKSASAISLDAEFSGIVYNSNLKNSLFDLGEDRYVKLKKNIEKFIALQVGITTFHYDREENKYTANMYNFYIFPRAFLTVDSRFVCQASSVEFLTEYDFDFNKCFKEGIPYLNVEQERMLRKDLKDGILFKHIDNRSIMLNNEQEVLNACEGWRVKPIHYTWSLHQTVKLLQKDLSKVAEWSLKNKSDKYMISHGALKNDEVLIYLFEKEVRRNYPNLWTTSTPDYIIIEKISTEKKKKLTLETSFNDDLDNAIVDSFLGFTKIFRLLVKSKKPLVGHNLLLDLMILYNQFHEPLPASYKKFKQKIVELFPNVYDTKHISYEFRKNLESVGKHSESWPANILKDLYEYFHEGKGKALLECAPEIVLEVKEVPRFKFTNMYHVAGWDSFACGYCLIKMGYYFAALKYGQEGFKRSLTSVEHIAGVCEFKNKVNIIRASVGYVNLDGPDPESNRPQALIIRSRTGRPVNSVEVSEMLAKYYAVDVKSLGPYSVLVAVATHANAREIRRDFAKNKDYCAQRYIAWKESKTIKILVWGGFIASVTLCASAAFEWFNYGRVTVPRIPTRFANLRS